MEGIINNLKYSARLQNVITDMLEDYKTIITNVKGIEQRYESLLVTVKAANNTQRIRYSCKK
ncbi:MAG: hypothetical protein ACI936_004205 [Paraglaciecola sp.]